MFEVFEMNNSGIVCGINGEIFFRYNSFTRRTIVMFGKLDYNDCAKADLIDLRIPYNYIEYKNK